MVPEAILEKLEPMVKATKRSTSNNFTFARPVLGPIFLVEEEENSRRKRIDGRRKRGHQ